MISYFFIIVNCVELSDKRDGVGDWPIHMTSHQERKMYKSEHFANKKNIIEDS